MTDDKQGPPLRRRGTGYATPDGRFTVEQRWIETTGKDGHVWGYRNGWTITDTTGAAVFFHGFFHRGPRFSTEGANTLPQARAIIAFALRREQGRAEKEARVSRFAKGDHVTFSPEADSVKTGTVQLVSETGYCDITGDDGKHYWVPLRHVSELTETKA